MKKNLIWRIAIPAAAVVVASATTVAAISVGFLSPALWGGYVGNDAAAAPSEAVTLVDGETTDNNLNVILSKILSDQDDLYLQIEIASKDGTPMQKNTETEYSNLANQQFEKAYLRIGSETYEMTCMRTDNASEPNKAYFELIPRFIDGVTDIRDFVGKKAEIYLDGFADWVSINQNLAFTYDNLAQIYEQLTPAKEEDFEVIDEIEYSDGSKSQLYTLPAGDAHIPFSSKYPNAYVDNMGFIKSGEGSSKRDWCYIGITLGEGTDAEALQRDLAFQNIQTKRYVPSAFHPSTNSSKRIVVILGVEFEQIRQDRDTTPEDLKNYRFAEVKMEKQVISGQWSIPFTLEQISNYRLFTVDKEVTMNWLPEKSSEIISTTAHVTQVELSALHLKIGCTVNAQEDGQPGGGYGLQIIRKDGSKVDINTVQHGMEGTGNKYTFLFNLRPAVDPDDVAAIVFCGQTIALDS